MAVKEIKDMGASVLARLKKQAKETGINYQTCLQLFAQEEFLRKLEISQYAENFILKTTTGCVIPEPGKYRLSLSVHE